MMRSRRYIQYAVSKCYIPHSGEDGGREAFPSPILCHDIVDGQSLQAQARHRIIKIFATQPTSNSESGATWSIVFYTRLLSVCGSQFGVETWQDLVETILTALPVVTLTLFNHPSPTT